MQIHPPQWEVYKNLKISARRTTSQPVSAAFELIVLKNRKQPEKQK